jgi:hypothetical protein
MQCEFTFLNLTAHSGRSFVMMKRDNADVALAQR